MNLLPIICLNILLPSSALTEGVASEGPDWPGWRGPNYNDATKPAAPLVSPVALKTAWKHSFGPGYSGFAISHGLAVTQYSDGTADYVLALEASSGKPRWKTYLDTTYRGHDGGNDGPLSTPVIIDQRIVALGPKGQLLALDLQTGKTHWSVNLTTGLKSVAPHWGFTASPLVIAGLVIVPTGGKTSLAAIHLDTGKTAWTATVEGDVNYQSPLPITFQGKRQIVTATDEVLYGLEPGTGRLLWQYRHGGESFYRRILNPLFIPPDKLLLEHKSQRIEIGATKQR